MEKSLEELVSISGNAWADSPYYENAEKWIDVFWGENTLFLRLFQTLDLSNVLELSCGYGRHAERVAPLAGALSVMDIFDNNLEVCRERLKSYGNVHYFKGNGHSFEPLDDGSITSIFCYDAAVHFEPELVKAYLADAARVLSPGGRFLLHHSNLDAPRNQSYGQNPHARNHMPGPLFDEYVSASGLEILESHVIPWGGMEELDRVSLLVKPV